MPDQFFQTREWGLFQESLGRKVYLLPKEESSDPLIAIQLPLKGPFSYLYCPRGPVYESPRDLEQRLSSLRDLGKTLHVSFVRVEPAASDQKTIQSILKKRKAKRVYSIQPTDVLLIDLSKGEEVLFSEMSPKCRYNIRLAAKKRVVIERINTRDECTDQIQNEFTALLQSTSSRNEFHLHPLSYYSALFNFFLPTTVSASREKPQGRLYIARYEGRAVAGAFILCYGNTSHYLHGGSLYEYRHVMAPYALHMAALFDAKQRGHAFYDFGGITLSDDPAASWAGITKFKKGFGGTIFSYHGTFDMVLSPVKYILYSIGRALRSRRSMDRTSASEAGNGSSNLPESMK